MRILLVRPDAIGDVVLMLPLINTLKSAYPMADIYTLQQPYTIPILHHHRSVTAIIPDWKRIRRSRGLRGFFAYAKYLKSFGFDMVFFPYLEPYYVVLSIVAGIPVRVGDSNKIGLRPFLTHSLPIDFRNLFLHETEQAAKLVWAVKPEVPLNLDMDLSVSDGEIDQAIDLIKSSNVPFDKYVVIHPNSGGGNRPWLPAKYAELIDELSTHGITSVLTGMGSREIQVIADIRSAASSPVIDLGGKTPLRLLMGVIAGASVIIGTDTGPTHIAAAMGRPVVSISPTKFVKSLRWGPWRTSNEVVSESSGCQMTCHPYRCKKNICLESISARRVSMSVMSLIDVSPKRNLPSKQAWIKTSIHSLLYWSGNSDRLDELIQKIQMLNRSKYVVHIAVRSWKFRRMLCDRAGISRDSVVVIPPFDWVGIIRLLNSRDVTAIYVIGPLVKWYWWIIRQLAALRQYAPPVLVTNHSDDVTEADIALTLCSALYKLN
ncbi:glycosyltransferase family 9 protein [bacterium]|nr:glycosyltransferase family 9 protein [bacterium]